MNYMAPEMEEIKIVNNIELLFMSGGDPDVYNEEPDPSTVITD